MLVFTGHRSHSVLPQVERPVVAQEAFASPPDVTREAVLANIDTLLSKLSPTQPFGGEPRARSPLEVPDRQRRDELFRRMDYNGNGGLSLAEIDKAVIELFPEYDHKPSLMRAYKAADVSGDGFIERREFKKLLHYLVYFNNVWHLFEQVDANGDRRLDLSEFKRGCAVVGVGGLSEAELVAEFDQIDENQGGYVLFDEFCRWCVIRHHGEETGEAEGMRASKEVAAATQADEQPSEGRSKLVAPVTESVRAEAVPAPQGSSASR